MLVGDCQLNPNVLFCARIALAFSRLNTSTVPCTRLRCSLNILPNRTSTCVTRAPYIVPGAMSAAVAVPVPRARPRFWTCVLLTVYEAVICGPGRFCSVALAVRPSHGNGYAAKPFTSG